MIYAYNKTISNEILEFQERRHAVEYISGKMSPARLTFEKLK